MPTDRINVGLVGCGNAGRNIHLRLLREHEKLYQVLSCADALAGKATELAAEAGIGAHGSVADLLADPQIELAVVATKPPRTHRDIALDAFAAGKHVVVEKPMAGTSEECEEMVQAAEAAGRVLAVHHNRRWDVDYLAARHAIESGAVGDVRLVRNEYTAGFSGSPYDWGIHLVDQTMTLSFGQRFVELTATFCQPDSEDPTESEGFFTCRLRTEDGVIHDLSMLPPFQGNAFRPGQLPWRFIVAGTKGVLYQDWCQRPADGLAKPSYFQPAEDGGTMTELPSVTARVSVPDFYDALHSSIREGTPSPVSGPDGTRAVRAWELICQSASEGRALSVDL